MSAHAASIADREGGLLGCATRQGAIEAAADALLEASDWAVAPYTVLVYTDPEWCEKAARFCEEHPHEDQPTWRWLTGWALEERVEIEVYLSDPDDEDSDPAWRHLSAIERLREAFPRLVWTARLGGISGTIPGVYAGLWCIFVKQDLSEWRRIFGTAATLGADPIAKLGAILQAEGDRLAAEADERATVAAMLGGVTRQGARIVGLLRANEEACESNADRDPCGDCHGCETRREREATDAS